MLMVVVGRWQVRSVIQQLGLHSVALGKIQTNAVDVGHEAADTAEGTPSPARYVNDTIINRWSRYNAFSRNNQFTIRLAIQTQQLFWVYSPRSKTYLLSYAKNNALVKTLTKQRVDL